MTIKEQDDFIYYLDKLLVKYKVAFQCINGNVRLITNFTDQCCEDKFNEYKESLLDGLRNQNILPPDDTCITDECGCSKK